MGKLFFHLLLVMSIFLPLRNLRAELTGREIIKNVLNRKTPTTTEVRVKMLLTDKNQNERIREISSFSKEFPDGRRTIMKFLLPADVKGMGFLQKVRKKGMDEQFMYLPELKRARRVTGSARKGSFFGSDLTYEDLESRDVDEDVHTLLRGSNLDGVVVYVVESNPKDPESTQYGKVIQWIRKDNYIPVRAEFYKDGELFKKLAVEKIDKIDGFWVAQKTNIKTLKTEHSTIIELLDIKNNKPIPDDVFTERFFSR